MDCEDKAVLLWRVKKENRRWTKTEIEQEVQRWLPGKKLCFLEDVANKWDDVTGTCI